MSLDNIVMGIKAQSTSVIKPRRSSYFPLSLPLPLRVMSCQQISQWSNKRQHIEARLDALPVCIGYRLFFSSKSCQSRSKLSFFLLVLLPLLLLSFLPHLLRLEFLLVYDVPGSLLPQVSA